MIIDFYTSNLKNKIAEEAARALSAETILASAIEDVEDAAFASVLYDASGHSIDFYNMDNDKIGSIDASDFIIDGMIEDVYLSGTILTITFNTDAGKQDIEVDFRELFDPSLYYTIQETDDAIASALTTANEYTDDQLESAVTIINDYIDEQVASAITVANAYTDEALSHIDLSEYATSADLVTVEEVTSRALNELRTDLDTVSGSIPDVSSFVTSGQVETQITSKNYVASSDVTIIDKLTQAEYDALVSSSAVSETTLYAIID